MIINFHAVKFYFEASPQTVRKKICTADFIRCCYGCTVFLDYFSFPIDGCAVQHGKLIGIISQMKLKITISIEITARKIDYIFPMYNRHFGLGYAEQVN